MDLTNGWDSETAADRDRTEEQIDQEKLVLLLGSPPCTYMSVLQELHMWIQKCNPELLNKLKLDRQ